MGAHSVSIRGGPQRVLLVGTLLAAHLVAHAESAAVQRFALSGSGTLRRDQSAQTAGSLTLRAYLTPSDATLAVSPAVQEGGGFVVMARLAAVATVCYNDTIFRDDFDGDGG